MRMSVAALCALSGTKIVRDNVELLVSIPHSMFRLEATMTQEFATGIVMAMIITSALMFSWIFRNIALALAAGAIIMAFIHGDGILGLMTVSRLMIEQYNFHPEFGRGALVGAMTAASIGCVAWSRRYR